MIVNLKAMIVVLAIAVAVFALAQPICLRFMAKSDFARRRNVWIALTLVAFMSPSFWLFAFVAVPLYAWGAGKDANPVAFYLFMLHVIPARLKWDIPVFGINQLFELSGYRLLSFAVLIPAAWRLIRLPTTDKARDGRFDLIIVPILAYGALQMAMLSPYQSITQTLRFGFLYAIDFVLLYYVVSRTCTSRRSIVESMAAFCLACAVFAPIGLFESLKGWLLYEGIGMEWGEPIRFAYLFRGGTLRAQVSAGHAVQFGYMMLIGFGFSLYLGSRFRSKSMAFVAAIWMWIGLLAAYTRAPWLAAALVFYAYLAIGPNGSARLFKALFVSVLAAGLVLVSPIGERVIDNLPFVGTVDAVNVSYRQELAARAWELIKQNPFFGNPFVVSYLEDLRQGQGIIDIVNVYAYIGMYFGLIGLGLFLAPCLAGMWNTYRLVKRSADPDLASLGANLIACMAGTLLMMAASGLGAVLEEMFYVLIGLAAGYARLGMAPDTDHNPRDTSSRGTGEAVGAGRAAGSNWAAPS